MLIFWLVVGARFFVPLLIPRFPLPAVVTALVLDGVDQSIFQAFTSLPLEGYQSYDKALDIYYLSIAYISTLRNWTNQFAFEISRFLYYYRLVGVVLFESTQIRTLLLIFPNTFEYFFIFLEAASLRWDMRKMTRRFLIGSAAFIWIFIKLPQEYWIHVAQLDTTDFIKERIFGVPTDTPWSVIFADNLWVFALAAVVGLLIFAAVRWLRKRLPKPDWPFSPASDAHLAASGADTTGARSMGSIWDRYLIEKVAMIALIGFIFGTMLPGMTVTMVQLVLGALVMAAINAGLSTWLARRGSEWSSLVREFAVMTAVNLLVVVGYVKLLPSYSGSVELTRALFFALLFTLIIVLYDRYSVVHRARFGKDV
jgi:hypothetical protein